MLKELSEAAGDELIVTCDVGQHQMWVAQHCRFSRPQAHLTSAGLGTMGYGIPAGIGALLAEPDATVITVTGDGSIMMNIQELATIRRYRLPLKILLLDNSQLGMVRQWQELFFDENFSEIDLQRQSRFRRGRARVRDRGLHHRLSRRSAGRDRAAADHRRADPVPRPDRSARECLAAGAAEQLEHRNDGGRP